MTARGASLEPRGLPGGSVLVASIGVVAIALIASVVTAVTGSPVGLAAAGALALGAILVVRPEFGVLLFLALLWLNVPAVLVSFHGVPNVAAQAAIVLLMIPVARYILRREPVIVTPALVAMLGFLGANLLSAAASTNTTLAAESVLTILIEGVLVYVLVSNAVRTPRMARMAIATLVVASVALSALAIFQEVTESYGDTYFGFAQNTVNENEGTSRDERPRMSGPIGEMNRFAQILLVVLPLALFGLGIQHGSWGKVVAIGAAVIIQAGIFLTFSRGAAVALAVVAVVLVVRRYVRLSHMLMVAAAFALTVVIVAPEFVGRVASIGAVAGWASGAGEDPDGAVVGRTTSNVAALLVFVDHPVIGVGPGVYPADYSIKYANRLGLRFFVEERRAHNMYVEWAAELGLAGLLTGVSMIGISLVQLAGLRSYWLSRRRDHADLAGAYWLALIAYAASAVFLHLSYLRYFFTLLALANSVIWMLQRERERWELDEASDVSRAPVG